MCGCRKAAPKAQTPPAQPRSLQSVSRNAPISGSTVALHYVCDAPISLMPDVPSGAKYQLTVDKTVRVYAEDADVLLDVACGDNGLAFERIE